MPDNNDQFADWNLAGHLPVGSVPLGFAAVLKYLNPEGNVALATATSAEIPDWECLGMHRTAVLEVEREIRESFAYMEGEDD